MTELERATQAYCQEHNDDCVEAIGDECPFIGKAFKAGAEWQKQQISSNQAMKYLQEHHSPSELSDFQAAMNIAVAKAIDSTINKAVEWLKGNIHYDENGEGNMEWVVFFGDDDEMVDNFKKYMEE